MNLLTISPRLDRFYNITAIGLMVWKLIVTGLLYPIILKKSLLDARSSRLREEFTAVDVENDTGLDRKYKCIDSMKI